MAEPKPNSEALVQRGEYLVSIAAWAGPWGIRFASKLTPHPDGSGLRTEAQFDKTLKAGAHVGVGRAVYAFLRTRPPISNVVPQPVSP